MSSDSSSSITDLEKMILDLYFKKYVNNSFQSPDGITVLNRINTGSGRYTYFKPKKVLNVPDGRLGVGLYGQFDMDGLDAGCSFWVNVENGMIDNLEIVVNGSQFWDGIEREIKMINPETGEYFSEF